MSYIGKRYKMSAQKKFYLKKRFEFINEDKNLAWKFEKQKYSGVREMY